ncbi:hypothetical protein WICPIJ_006279 [Wickerhamomyces pijperi]|uniref:Pseudouridine synthase n=1 Tax=Wickerhamomyces pijperi TaxID=599730 RepID=A0A9P8TL43_WICPI|nr:hypothetical protein WICPIJ_006279 [Wickerhamomyces pijperi]
MSTSVVEHYIHNGLRKIKPYHHTATNFVKGRWLNRTILEVLIDEFRTRDEAYYTSEILQNRIIITRQNEELKGEILKELKIQNKDKLTMITHKHEPMVKAYPNDRIPIIYEDEQLVIVDKPSSVPVHPTARFVNNTLTEILKVQLKLQDNIYPCHRLDKLTSGIVILAKDTQSANKIQSKIQIHSSSSSDKSSMQKTYLAKVQGRFPYTEPLTFSKPLLSIDTKKGFTNGITPAREATTVFKLYKYDPVNNESIVWCEPQTGRTHQIRIHLKLLGYPITNDPLYGPNASPYRSKLIDTDLQISEDEKRELFEQLSKETRNDIGEKLTGEKCHECGELEFRDPIETELELYLHAFRYVLKFDKDESGLKGLNGSGVNIGISEDQFEDDSTVWKFETEMPEWAANFGLTG